jgi:hypothetical protein
MERTISLASPDTMDKIGIIQSRGLGDIVISLPIAKYYHDQGYKVMWPICEEFLPSFRDSAPWVKWIPVPTDSSGEFFYNEPMRRLKNFGCTEFLTLYQSLTGHPEFSEANWFQIQKFDEYKYTRAGVPFLLKWSLNECITRNESREQSLYDRLVSNPKYYVTHVKGSTFTAPVDLSNVPESWGQHIEITELTDCVFDWLKIIQGAQGLIMVDSVYANIVDQLQIQVEKYWIPRSHIHLSPVLGSEWTILEPPVGSGAAQPIFGSR